MVATRCWGAGVGRGGRLASGGEEPVGLDIAILILRLESMRRKSWQAAAF